MISNHSDRVGGRIAPADAADFPMRNHIFVEGDELYDAMLVDIGAARRRILIETYIFREDHIGKTFLSALCQAAERGVVVAMRVDAFGSKGLLSAKALYSLRQSGVEFKWSRRWTWRHPFRYNRRNHRKLLIVDGRVAYLGGFNIGDESSFTHFGAERWRDTHIRLIGPIIERAALLFRDFADDRQCRQLEWKGESLLMPNYGLACRYRLRCFLHESFSAAKRRIWLTNPYFVPDRRTQKHLMAAARRGVDVKLILPGKSDVPIARWAARASYANLLKAGVKIYEYGNRFLHAKTALIDEGWSTIGTSNLDYRSFFVNYELNLFSRSASINQELSAIFSNDLLRSTSISRTSWSKRSRLDYIFEFIGWVGRRWL